MTRKQKRIKFLQGEVFRFGTMECMCRERKDKYVQELRALGVKPLARRCTVREVKC